MVSKKKVLNSKAKILSVRQTTCWYCHLHGYNICDEWGCCKRCGTNLKKWTHRGKLIYPSLNDERLAQEVLGSRERCGIPPDNPQISVPENERHSGKVNHCQICWQKTIVFIWSTSRVIDKEKLEKIDQFKNVVNLERLGYPVCWACAKEHNLIEEKNATRKIQQIIEENNSSY